MINIFLKVVRRDDDPFFGFKELLSKDKSNKIFYISLSEDQYDLVKKVEFSWRRYFRFLYYKKIFLFIEQKLKEILINEIPCNVFLPDEGVWGLFINESNLKKKYLYKTINVQHGYFSKFYLRQKNTYHFRYLLNKLSRIISNYPTFGYGVGYGGFDVYCCYSKKQYDYLKFIGNKNIFICPYTLKKDLINKYYETKNNFHKNSVVVYLPTTIPGSGYKSLNNLLDLLQEFIIYLNQMQYKIDLRLHPGADRDNDINIINNSSLIKYVSIEKKCSNLHSFKNHNIIISANSTAIIEAEILNKTSVCIGTKYEKDPYGYFKNYIDLDKNNWRDKVKKIFISQNTSKINISKLNDINKKEFLNLLKKIHTR